MLIIKKRIFLSCLSVLILVLIFTGCQSNQSKKPVEENRPDNQQTTPIVKEIPKFTYEKMEGLIGDLQTNYNQLTVSEGGKSVGGRNLYRLLLGDGPVKINVVGGVHGREGITSLLILRLIEDYLMALENNEKIGGYDLQDIFSKVEFNFVPMLNPDGVEIAVTGTGGPEDRSFYIQANEGEEDLSRWKTNGRGVDLNKQFGADWEAVESTDRPHFEGYKGSQPESEPESKWLVQLTREESFDSIVAFHNSGSVIFWYYNQEGEAYQRDFQLAQSLGEITGYEVVEPEDSDLKAAGYKDWFVKEFGRPGFTIEIGDGQATAPLPSEQLDRYFVENREVLLELAYKLTVMLKKN